LVRTNVITRRSRRSTGCITNLPLKRVEGLSTGRDNTIALIHALVPLQDCKKIVESTRSHSSSTHSTRPYTYSHRKSQMSLSLGNGVTATNMTVKKPAPDNKKGQGKVKTAKVKKIVDGKAKS
jgi:hypothetical protein